MAGICIDKLAHHCGTTRGLQVFADKETGKVDGFCFSCSTYVANPYGEPLSIEDIELPEPDTEEEIQREIAEIGGYPCVDIPSRKLRGQYLEAFGVKVSMDESDGKTPTAMYFPITKSGKLVGYYGKTLSKPSQQWSVGDVKGGDPFGWEQAKRSGAYKLIITEGREDAIAVFSMFSRFSDEKYMPAVIALPNGTNSVDKSLTKIADVARRTFKEIIINFDDDESGDKATEKAMLIFPNALTVSLPDKDANECLIRGSQKAAYKALAFQAGAPKNTRLVRSGPALHASAREPTPYGELTWPWPTLNKWLRNIRYGETIYIGAGVKMGKSELVNAIGAHFIKEHGVDVLMAKPEEENKKTYKMVCGKIVGDVFHDPDRDFNYEAYDRAGKIIGDKLVLLDLYQHMGWDTLKLDIIYAAKSGVKAVFIDPITNLTSGISAADANTKLQEIAVELSSIAKDLNIVIFIFCHLKAPEGNLSADARLLKYKKGQYHSLGNCPHERGGDVLSSQFAGSRAMMRSCNLMLGLEGNKDPELPENIRNLRWLTILEDREFGNSESLGLYWNRNTTLFTEA